MHVAKFKICFVKAVMKPGPSDFKGGAKDIYIGRHLGSVVQSDGGDDAFVHDHITYFGVIPNLDSQCFELTHLRIDENRL